MNDEQFLRIVDATPLVSIDLIIRNERDEVLLGWRKIRGSCPGDAFARTSA
jgi:colanic acid biosynthesis protein WcaH